MNCFQRTASATLLLVALAGCATDGGTTFGISDRGDRYCLQAGALSAGAGALAGAGVGALASGGDATATLVGAAIGAVVGAVAGCQYGVWVANERESYETETARLDAELANAKRTNESIAELNEVLEKGIADREATLAELQRQRRKGATVAAEQRQLAEELRENRQGIAQQVASAEAELKIQRQTYSELQALKPGEISAQKLAQHRQEIERMEREVAEMRGLTQQYASVESRVRNL